MELQQTVQPTSNSSDLWSRKSIQTKPCDKDSTLVNHLSTYSSALIRVKQKKIYILHDS